MAFPRHSQGFFLSLFAWFRQISTHSSVLRTFPFSCSSHISPELCILLALQKFLTDLYLCLFNCIPPILFWGRWKTYHFLDLNFKYTQKIHPFRLFWWIFCDSNKISDYFRCYLCLFFTYQLNDSFEVYCKYSHCPLHLHVNKAWWCRCVITMPVL